MGEQIRSANSATPVVAAVLRAEERSRVEAAGSGWFAVVHGDSIPDAIRVVRERSVDAVLVSVHRRAGTDPPQLDQLVRAFPGLVRPLPGHVPARAVAREPHEQPALRPARREQRSGPREGPSGSAGRRA